MNIPRLDVRPGVVALVVSVFGEDCGTKCTSKAEVELWTLDAEGSQQGRALPSSCEGPCLLEGGARASRTTFSWADGDGVGPLEILVESSEGGAAGEGTSRFVVGYDPQRSRTRFGRRVRI